MISAPSFTLSIFRYQKFSQTQKGSSTKFFSTVERKIFNRRSLYSLHLHHPLIYEIFVIRKFLNLNIEGFVYEVSQLCQTKAFWRKIVIATPFFPDVNRYQKGSEVQKRSLTKFFGTLRNQGFSKKSRYSTRRRKICRYPKLSETQKCSSMNWFTTLRQNKFDGKTWYPPNLLSPKLVDIRRLLKHGRVPLRNVALLWDKAILTQSRDISPLLIPIFFATRIFLKHRKVSLRNFQHFGMKNFQKKIAIPFCIKYKKQWWSWCF